MTLATFSGRKRALRALDANRLRDLVDAAGLTVADRRARDGLIQALADARRLDFSTVIGRLTRDELKAMCRALGLAEDGREKAPIIDRLMGPDAASDDDLEEEPDAPVSAIPWRTQVLELLKRDELSEVVEKLELGADRRSHQSLRDALEQAGTPLTVVLENLPRARLKELCRVLGLEDGGKEKAPIVQRIASEGAPPGDEDSEARIEAEAAPSQAPVGPEVLTELLGPQLTVDDVHGYWPAKCSLAVGGQQLVVDLHVRVIGGTGRNPLERRFQNPASGGAITPTHGRPCLLLGVWVEQGMRRAVVVAFDAYRRKDRTTRFSLFMPLSLLEEAADIGFVSHVTASGEKIHAFRPDSIARYLDAFSQDANWGHLDPGAWARPKLWSASAAVRPLAPPQSTALVEIRPKSGMFAAFARLNYKPWFALAELVDNAVQSFLEHRDRFVAAGSTGPLIVDVNLDEDEISVTDRAAGIRLEDFPRAFSPATPPSDATGLSEFGLGMKAAACWFAKEWSVRTSPIDEAVERTISFDVPKITREGLDHLPIQTRESRADDHFTVVTMRDLRVRPRGSTLAKIKEHLASIYRLLIADGTVRIRVTTSGKTEELAYVQPKLLVAPFYARPHEPPREWRREIDVELGSRRVTGWAGLMEAGKHSRAGFAVFRRRRLIEGSVGEAYRPRAVFGAHNSFASQRLVGELYVEGFDVTHTKDGIQWGEDEQDLAYGIRNLLDEEEMPILDQANGYRAKKSASMLPIDFGREAITATAAATASLDISTEIPTTAGVPVFEDEPPASELKSGETAFQQRAFRMTVDGDREWDVHLELVRDKAADWLDARTVEKDGQEHLQIRINLDHAFSEDHLNDNERALNPVLRLAVAMAIGEWQARMQGVRSSAAVRRNANELLRKGLSSVPMADAITSEDE